jgi:hypothetical protein
MDRLTLVDLLVELRRRQAIFGTILHHLEVLEEGPVEM